MQPCLLKNTPELKTQGCFRLPSLLSEPSVLSDKCKVENEDDHHRPHEGVYFTPTAFDRHGDWVEDKANGQTF